MIVRKIQNNLFCLKLGLKSIIALKDFSQIDREIEIKLLLLSNPEVGAAILWQLSASEVQQLFIDCFKDAFEKSKTKSINTIQNILSFIKDLNLEEELKSLYSIAVGQIGISPSAFYSLTPFEIQLAYQGYLQKEIGILNCLIVAGKRVRSNNSNLVCFNQKDYSESSREARLRTFQELGIKGE